MYVFCVMYNKERICIIKNVNERGRKPNQGTDASQPTNTGTREGTLT